MVTSLETFQEALSGVVSRHLGCSSIKGLRRLSGGAVSESWWFDAEREDRKYECILRLARSSQTNPNYPDKETEARIQMATIENGVPVPEVYFILDQEDGIGSGYVMQRIVGETIPRKILRDDEYSRAREQMAKQCGEILYGIHSVEPNMLPKLAVLKNKEQLELLQSLYDSFVEYHPIFDLAISWLNAHTPKETEPRLVHSDFRNGNFIVGSEGIRAILDWEMAHVGDPMEDLGWLCVNSWRFGNIDKPGGGFGEREDLFAGYETAGGLVDKDRVHFWEVFGTLKWGLICLVQAFTHLNNTVRSVELAAIGRRVSETEIDLLNLLT